MPEDDDAVVVPVASEQGDPERPWELRLRDALVDAGRRRQERQQCRRRP